MVIQFFIGKFSKSSLVREKVEEGQLAPLMLHVRP